MNICSKVRARNMLSLGQGKHLLSHKVRTGKVRHVASRHSTG